MLATLLVLGLSQAQAAPEWEALPLEGAPLARADETIVWSGAEFLVWGGVDAKDVYLDSGAAYDPVKRTWRSLPRDGAPSARAWHTAVWSGAEMLIWNGTEVLIWGGSRSITGGMALGDGARLDPRTGKWTPITAEGGPAPRYSHGFALRGAELLILGGAVEREGDALRDVWARSAEGSWKKLPDLPAGRAAGHAFSTEHGVFFLGGRDAAMKLHSGGFFLPAG